MADRTLVASATNLLARGYLVVPTDRRSPGGDPVNALFAVARAIQRVMAFKLPSRAVAVIDAGDAELDTAGWPPLLAAQLPALRGVLETLGLRVVEAPGEVHAVASYAQAALDGGHDVIVVGVDKRFAQLVSDRLWWYDANKDARYTPEMVQKRFLVPPAQVAEWLALVGDDDALPGVAGIGAKGAAGLLEAHGSIERALASAASIAGRPGNVLRSSPDAVRTELARARLDLHRPLPVALDALAYAPPPAAQVNALYDRLGFVELLAPEGAAVKTRVCDTPDELATALAGLGPGPLAVHAVMENPRDATRGGVNGPASPGHPPEGGYGKAPLSIDEPEPAYGALVGLAIAAGTGEALYAPLAGAGRCLAGPELLAGWLGDAAVPKLGHALEGVLAALARAGIRPAGFVGDSAAASHLTQPSNWAPHDLPLVAKHVLGRALPADDTVRGVGQRRKPWSELPVERAAELAGQYADATAAVWQKLAPPLPDALIDEYLALTDTVVRMELTGLVVDRDELARAEHDFAAIETDLQHQIEGLAGRSFNINSSKQLGAVLFEELKLPIVSHTKTGWSTAIEALERIEHAHPIVPLVIRWRLLRRMRDSWLHALRDCITADGRVHSQFHPARSFSGRLVNTNPDLGRVPGRTPEMQRIRRAFVAPPGCVLLSVDYRQLGLHVLAHLTRDPELVEPLRRRHDLHVLTAAAVLERPAAEITDAERQIGKVVNFATFAGQGASALALQLGVPAQDARELIARFDRRYAQVRAFQDEQLRLARERGYIETIAGRRWPIGGLESLDPHDRSYAERMARRATHEGSVADVSRRGLLDADRALRRAGLAAAPVLQIHDEVLFEVPEAELADTARITAEAMRRAFALEAPLRVSVEAGPTWADLAPFAVGDDADAPEG
ncbi:MAG TPA: DNA polymerase [Kofleriaceae bacterium]|jgi:DNA polymerase-1|nr:DNA polymerase [Kofleriaceae bacterium]